MEEARAALRDQLTKLKTYLMQEPALRLTEADTKAHFIEPIIASLGWVGIGVVTREYYVKNSHEFIDYALFAKGRVDSSNIPSIAIEAKALQVDLTEKHAAQLIQYCAVEGIEWAVLTNARELQFFNTFLKPDLGAKRVMRLDLVAAESDDDFDFLFEQLWQLSRVSITSASVRIWLKQVRLDQVVRKEVLDPNSSTVKQLLDVLANSDLQVSPDELIQWFRTHLSSDLPRFQTELMVDSGSPQRHEGGDSEAYGSRIPQATLLEETVSTNSELMKKQRRNPYHGITLWDLVLAGLLPVGTPLILMARAEVLTRAEVGPNGEILWCGETYRSLSDRAFFVVFDPPAKSFNGWINWHAELPSGRVQMSELRDRLVSSKGLNGH